MHHNIPTVCTTLEFTKVDVNPAFNPMTEMALTEQSSMIYNSEFKCEL